MEGVLFIGGDLGAGSDNWLGFLMLYKASAKSAARFNTISWKSVNITLYKRTEVFLC